MRVNLRVAANLDGFVFEVDSFVAKSLGNCLNWRSLFID